ncbi:hypothetical protein PPO43_02960 [Saprospira sp. CCB-QB6]|uniref:hypothetical protein n=1 Tax=Saprospira sp. CCB-QB6 TaxID=3023936 RepID=UPI00234BD83B|nr:hypothetical protein [Saprospira sp. CCB-QB6]WCL82061.1 hypothetical protein PPO43_02960 [Saprospira sp. CCB-QB6]
MTAEQLQQLIAEPEALKKTSYEELEQLLLNYPSSSLLRALLLIKLGQNQGRNYYRQQQLFAFYDPKIKGLRSKLLTKGLKLQSKRSL